MAVGSMRRRGSPSGRRCGFRRCLRRPRRSRGLRSSRGLERDLQRLVIYRDDHVLVVNKPHGMPVQGGPGISHHLDGLLDALRFGSPERPRLVHRLDRDTSGVLLLARTPGTAAKLAAAFRSRAVEKTYWAVVAASADPAGGPHRSAAAAHRRRARRTHRDCRARRQGRRPRHHRLSHARSCGAEACLAGAEPADRAHAPASRALRRDRRADPGRREIRAARPEQRVQRHGGGALKRTSLACARASAAPSRGRNIAGGGGPAAPHDRDVPHPGLSRAGGARSPAALARGAEAAMAGRTLPRGVRIGLWSLAGVVGLIVVAGVVRRAQLRS